jgi:hypothetical protein
LRRHFEKSATDDVESAEWTKKNAVAPERDGFNQTNSLSMKN